MIRFSREPLPYIYNIFFRSKGLFQKIWDTFHANVPIAKAYLRLDIAIYKCLSAIARLTMVLLLILKTLRYTGKKANIAIHVLEVHIGDRRR